MGVDQSPPLFKLHIANRSARRNTCVAECIIDFTKLPYDIRAPILHGVSVSHIGDCRYRLAAIASNGTASFIKAAGAKIAQRHPVTSPRKANRRGPTEPAPCTRDNTDLGRVVPYHREAPPFILKSWPVK
jgi:hypothetical protein